MKGLGFVVSEKIFLDFPIKKTYKPQGVTIFCPGVIILTNLVEDHLVMLHTKNQNMFK